MPWGRAGSRVSALSDRDLTLQRGSSTVELSARIDVHGSGTELPVAAEGSGLSKAAVALYLAADADIAKGDVFYLSDLDQQFRVLYVEEPTDFDGNAAFTIAYCDVYQP